MTAKSLSGWRVYTTPYAYDINKEVPVKTVCAYVKDCDSIDLGIKELMNQMEASVSSVNGIAVVGFSMQVADGVIYGTGTVVRNRGA